MAPRQPWLSHATQTAYREQYRAARPGWQSSGDQFDALVQKHLTAESAVLDLGCGRTGGIERFWKQAHLAVGVDPDLASLAARDQGMAVMQGSGEHLPFAGASFDMVVSVWVLEHLPEPARVFAEVARVLKPLGHFIFLTPNALNPLVMGNRVSQLAPSLQKQMVANVYGRDGADTFAVRYRANTKFRIKQMAAPAGFAVAELRVIADPTYVAFNALLYKAAMLSDRILPQGLGVHLLGDLQRLP
ncbi:MAG TPA: class I SAM-dependent methyltransferase [Candidatus Dormibacteraeota bacterium]|nr:class I SAM-dependent methyltransferase [Candidatus Dormibacteraeota bacterium]